MKRFKILLAISVAFAALAISSSAFANEGRYEVAASPKALAAASSYSYDQAQLQAVGNEAGVEVIPSAKALTAAKSYQFDANQFAKLIEDGANAS